MTVEPVALRAPVNLVSRRAIGYWAVRAGLGWLILLGIETAWLAVSDAPSGVLVLVPVGTVIVAAAHLVVMPLWRYRVHRWETTEQAVYTQTGWFTQERRIAPISRIQTVDSEFGVLERLFGLANVTVTTASAAGPIKIHGLQLDDANRLVAQLTTTTAQTPGDAT